MDESDKTSPPVTVPAQNPRQWIVGAAILGSLLAGFFGGTVAVRLNEAQNGAESAAERLEIVSNESELIADIAERIGPSVVSVNVEITSQGGFFYDQLYTEEGAGTGIIVDSNGLVLTNKHVIPQNVTSVSVVLSDGTVYEDVEVVDRDSVNDIAFLRIKGAQNLTAAALGDSDAMRVGDKVIAVGNALGEFSNTVTTGIVSGIGRPIVASDGEAAEQLQNLFQTDAAINPGNSGGPLLNANGEVIGLNTAVASEAENIGFAIPINDIKPVLSSVQESGEIIRPYLGVRYVMLTPSIAKELEVEQSEGALLTAGTGEEAILAGSPADKAGLKEDDVIIRVGDEELGAAKPLSTVLGRYKVGDVAKLTIIRDGNEQTIDVTLEKAPENL